METEAHVYALAIAASTLLAFFPFMMVMLAFCRDVLRWPAAQQAIYLAVGDFFAGEPGQFLVRNLQPYPELEKLRFWRRLRRIARLRRKPKAV